MFDRVLLHQLSHVTHCCHGVTPARPGLVLPLLPVAWQASKAEHGEALKKVEEVLLSEAALQVRTPSVTFPSSASCFLVPRQLCLTP